MIDLKNKQKNSKAVKTVLILKLVSKIDIKESLFEVKIKFLIIRKIYIFTADKIIIGAPKNAR